ncbi:MAG: DUF3592 domain-containing protein [Terracidiphilus sp.]
MLIEIWERLRGYDKWIQNEATIKSSETEEAVIGHSRYEDEPIYAWQENQELQWKDLSGAERSQSITVGENSPIFKLYEGKSVTIRYNPDSPGNFYVRDELRRKVNFTAKIVLGIGALVCIICTLSTLIL